MSKKKTRKTRQPQARGRERRPSIVVPRQLDAAVRGVPCDAFEWALNVAHHIARDYPEEVDAVERVRGFMRKRIAGETSHIRVDDVMFVFGLIIGAIERDLGPVEHLGPWFATPMRLPSAGELLRGVNPHHLVWPQRVRRVHPPRGVTGERSPWRRRRRPRSIRSATPGAARVAARGANSRGSPRRRRCSGSRYTAAGAAGTALVGSFLSREGWAPKTIATALGAVGAGLAWKGDGSTIRSVGAGAMSAAGSQLALMLIDDHEKKTAPTATAGSEEAGERVERAAARCAGVGARASTDAARALGARHIDYA